MKYVLIHHMQVYLVKNRCDKTGFKF